MTEFHQNFLSLLREPLSIFRLISLYQTDRYPWSFDSIHSHCHDDVILILNILKNFKEHLRGMRPARLKKTGSSGTSPPISLVTGAPYRLTQFMPGYQFKQIMSCLTITKITPDNTDRFWEMRLLISAWNKNMQDIYVPSWVSCLDESMSIWNMRWSCPGYVFCPRKPHPVGNEYHTIADGFTTILYATEIVMGKDKPDDFESACSLQNLHSENAQVSFLFCRGGAP
jgi:hypothetical protein